MGDVRDALPNSEADSFGKIQRMAAKLVDPGFECDPRPQAWLLEEERDRPIRQGLRCVPAPGSKLTFESDCPLEDEFILVARQVRRADEIPTAQPSRRRMSVSPILSERHRSLQSPRLNRRDQTGPGGSINYVAPPPRPRAGGSGRDGLN